MTDVAAAKPSPPLVLMERAIGLLDGVSYALLALPRICACSCAAARENCRSTMYCGDACAVGSAQKRKRRDDGAMQLFSTITCPACGHRRMEEMPADACRFFYDCTTCGARMKPKPGDCCVFCSYGDIPCPPVQAARENGDRSACCRQDRGP
jgi:hypothetical protein